MRSVTRFEHNLLRLLHFFLRQAPIQQALPLLEAKLDRPKCLGRNAVALVQDTLAKGCVLLLTRDGGWRRERFLREDRPVEGRLWERTPPNMLGLTFSRNTLDFLIWITAKKETDDTKKEKPWQPVADATLGDLMLLYFAVEQLRELRGDLPGNMLATPPLDRHGLAWLCFPDEHARASNTAEPDFKPWVEGVGACVIEALQPRLADRWVEMEIEKANLAAWQQMRDVGNAQARALEGFLKAVEAANRLDLARFLLLAASRVVTASATAQLWVKNLRQHGQRLADRADTYKGAMAFLRQLPRLQQWARNARAVGYFDDGYQASQLWLADWERFEGDALTERAQVIVRQLDPMRQTEG